MLTMYQKPSGVESSLPVHCDIETEFKIRLSPTHNHVKAYLGLRHSIDGWRYLLGFKIAGVKVKFPIYIIDETSSVASETEVSKGNENLKSIFIVFGVFLGASYLLRKYTLWSERKKLNLWLTTDLLTIRNKQE